MLVPGVRREVVGALWAGGALSPADEFPFPCSGSRLFPVPGARAAPAVLPAPSQAPAARICSFISPGTVPGAAPWEPGAAELYG